jgi:hypothetical protein
MGATVKQRRAEKLAAKKFSEITAIKTLKAENLEESKSENRNHWSGCN